MKVEYTLLGSLVEPPKNNPSLEIEINHDEGDPQSTGSITLNNLDFVTEAVDALNDYQEDGKNGGAGVFEGPPLDINLIAKDGTQELFKGFVNLATGATSFSCDSIDAPIVLAGGLTWLEAGAEDSFTFEKLYADGFITDADFIKQPYVISSIPSSQDIAITTISIYVIIMELRNVAIQLQFLIAEVAGVTTTLPALVKVLLYVIYLVLLAIALINLISDLINFIIQPIKYHACMKIKLQLEKGAEYLGMSFASTIFDDPLWLDAVTMPEKFAMPSDVDTPFLSGITSDNNIDQKGYFDGTYGDLLEEFRKMVNGKKIVSDGVIRIERRDYTENSPDYELQPLEMTEHKINSDELISNWKFRFQVDFQDDNTVDNYEGTICSVIRTPNIINNPDMVLMRGFEEIGSRFALSKPKTEFTRVEDFFNTVLQTVGVLIDTIEIYTGELEIAGFDLGDVGNLIENRLGMLSISSDSFAIPKIFVIDQGTEAVDNKISDLSADLFHAEQIYDRYYEIDSFVVTSTRPDGNQWIRKSVPPFNLCFADLQKLITNNLIFTSEGQLAKVESLKFNVESERVTSMTIRINEHYTTNLKEEKFVPDGL